MRKIVVTEIVSLDGVFEEPAWTVRAAAHPELSVLAGHTWQAFFTQK